MLLMMMIVAADLVTETDKAVEKYVISALREHYPDYEYFLPPLLLIKP